MGLGSATAIGTGAEGAVTCSAQHGDPDVGVGIDRAPDLGEFHIEAVRDRVQCFRAVQGHPRDVIGDLENQFIGHELFPRSLRWTVGSGRAQLSRRPIMVWFSGLVWKLVVPACLSSRRLNRQPAAVRTRTSWYWPMT